MNESDIGTQLFIQYQAAMTRRALRYVFNIHDAEDVVSDCWLSLISRFSLLSSMDERARSAYILTAVRNAAIDYLRKRERHGTSHFPTDHSDNTPPNFIDAVIDQNVIESLLEYLPPHTSKVVRYKLHTLDDSKIAELIGIRQSSVRVYWLRGREQLRRLIQALNE